MTPLLFLLNFNNSKVGTLEEKVKADLEEIYSESIRYNFQFVF